MSTFGGKIQEIPYISVDRFDGVNLDSEVYFLSHCHSDHMRGLDDWFWQHLRNNKRYLYASKVSCAILAQRYPTCVNNIKELCVHTPSTFNVHNNSLSVTSIPAGHCPGSIMFLFISDYKKILYTGDYRITKDDIRKIKHFYNSFKEIIKIDKIYLDTTFFLKSYLKFPKRKESLEQICQIIHNHITQGRQFMIHIITGAYIGYECVFKGIFNTFKMPVHVNEIDYEFYRLIPEMDASVTMDGSITQIHCNCTGFKKICDFSLNSNVLKLKVTAWNWISESFETGISYYDPNESMYCVCFSTHASLEESEALIRFLKPKEIGICVERRKSEENEEMNDIIDNLLNEIHSHKKIVSEPHLFQTDLKAKKKKRYNTEMVTNSYPSSILDSPPREKRLPSYSEEYNSPSKRTISKSVSTGTAEIECLPVVTTENVNTIKNLVEASCSNIENKTAPCSNVDIFEEEIAQSSQISLEELQISPEKHSEDVLLSIIEDNNDKFSNNIEKFDETGLNTKNITSNHNSEDNIIINLIGSQEIFENENISSSLDSNSQNILLDIINYEPPIR